MQEKPPMPKDHMALAIVSTLLCCMPLGVVSIVYASKVSTLYANGDYEEARRASGKAKTWAIISIGSVFAAVVLTFILALLSHVIPLFVIPGISVNS